MTEKQKKTIKKLKRKIETYERFFKKRKNSRQEIHMSWEVFYKIFIKTNIKKRRVRTNKMEEKKARELQMKVIRVFERENIEQLHVYAILEDLVKVLKKYLKKEEDLDVDKLKESANK